MLGFYLAHRKKEAGLSHQKKEKDGGGGNPLGSEQIKKTTEGPETVGLSAHELFVEKKSSAPQRNIVERIREETKVLRGLLRQLIQTAILYSREVENHKNCKRGKSERDTWSSGNH